MTGATAEQSLIGALLLDNRQAHVVDRIVKGEDFDNPHLGRIYDGILTLIHTGHSVEAASLEAHLPDWDVRGITPDMPWRWIDATLYPGTAYATATVIRRDAVRRRGKNVFGQALAELGDTGTDPSQVIEAAVRAVAETGRDTLDAVPLSSLLDTPTDEAWVVPDLLEAQDRLILTGYEGLGKTTMIRQLLIPPAAGIHPFTMTDMEPTTALVIDAENTARQWARATAFVAHRSATLGGTDPTKRIHVALSGRINLTDPATVGGIHRMIDKHKPDMVFLGPLYRMAVKMNNDDDAAPVIAAMDSIRDRGVALIVEAHGGHAMGSNGQRDVRPRGSSSLLGWPEFGFGIRPSLADPTVFDFVAWRGAREARAWPSQIRRGNREFGEFPWKVVEW